MRSGTVPAPLVVGFGAAAALAQREMQADTEHIRRLAHRLYEGVTSQLDGVVLNGPGDLDGRQRYIGNLNLSFAYVEGESLLMGLKVTLHAARSADVINCMGFDRVCPLLFLPC